MNIDYSEKYLKYIILIAFRFKYKNIKKILLIII